MGYEKYYKAGDPNKHTRNRVSNPVVGVRKNGKIWIPTAIARECFAGVKKVNIYYNIGTKVMAIKPAEESDLSAHTIYPDNSGMAIATATPFIREADIKMGKNSVLFSAKWNKLEKMLVVDTSHCV